MMAPRRPRVPFTGLAVLLFLTAAAWWAARSGDLVLADDPPTATAQTPPAPQQPRSQPEPATRARIQADATRAHDGPAAGPSAVCGLPEGELAARVSEGLEGFRIAAECSQERLPVYGARLPDGAALLLVNRGDTRAEFDLGIRLTRGVYSVDRVTFISDEDGAADQTERLQSAILGGTGTLGKPGLLEPGEGAIYRFVNRSAQTASAFKSVKDRMRALRSVEPGEYSRLMAPLREAESNVGALSKGIAPSKRYDYLRYIHRALLTVAHAQALCRNSRGMGRIDEAHDVYGLEAALDRLEESLTEMSVGCLGLQPRVVVSPLNGATDTCKVAVVLSNGGGRSVDRVKLGVTAPAGTTVQPANVAFFRAVQPGQTVRAAFTVRLDEQAADRAVTADVSYFAARAPAHLRLKALIGNQQS